MPTKRTKFLALFFSAMLGFYFITKHLVKQKYITTYTRLQEVQLDPLGLRQFPAGSVFEADSSRNKVMFFGDSRARGWKAPLGMKELQFANRGVNGHTTAQCLGRFEQHVVAQQPDILVIQMGINDLKTLPLFPGKEPLIIDRCMENTHAQISRARELGMTVILSEVFPVGDIPWQRRMVWSEAVDVAVAEVNQAFRKWAEADEGVFLLESNVILAGEDGHVKKEYQRDFLHLNELGYVELNAELVETLKSVQP